jgi:glycerol-3-phosphate acyltransferase PlsY
VLLPLLIALAYLLGSIPFGLLIARAKGVDIRQHGSGNIGATNVWRVLGPRLGLLCFALDFLKGFVPALAAGFILHTINNPAATPQELLGWLSVPVACIAGHLFPVWLKFKGGKGVATSFGAMLGVFPVLTLAVLGALVVWLISAKLTKMVGISSCFAAIALPTCVWLQHFVPASWRSALAGAEEQPTLWPYLVVTFPLAALVIVKHRANIARTIAGTEIRIGQRRPPPA